MDLNEKGLKAAIEAYDATEGVVDKAIEAAVRAYVDVIGDLVKAAEKDRDNALAIARKNHDQWAELDRASRAAPAPEAPLPVTPMAQRVAAATSIAMMAREWYGEPTPSTKHLSVNVIAKRLARFYPDAPAPAPDDKWSKRRSDGHWRTDAQEAKADAALAPAPAPEGE
jgi:hypothetical protein